jgi:hypothetical protein
VGTWTRKLEPTDPEYATNGQECDPWEIDPLLGTNRGCSSPIVSGVACGGFGPPDMQFSLSGQGGMTAFQFSGSQEPYFEQTYADGVYAILPMSGVVIWNSHAFNLTDQPSTMAQYLNIDYAPEENQVYPVEAIFMSEWIFAQNALPFEKQDVCGTYTIPQGANLFELSSHTHLRGTGWRTWGPPNTPCQPGCPTPYNSIPFGGFQLCNEDPDLPICEGPRTDAPLYFSNHYSDPLQLQFDPPLHLDSPDDADRTFLFCSTYDNGSTPNSPPVKRRSTTPMPPPIPGLADSELLNQFGVGGPCPPKATFCADGPNKGQLCAAAPINTLNAADHALCGDPALELCDACAVRGGVTTQDEMFILTRQLLHPEPGALALGGAALAALALRVRGRRGSRPIA